MDLKLKELKDDWYCQYEYGEKLTVHSYKHVQVTSDLFKIYVCNELNKLEVFTYDQEGNLLEKNELYYGKPMPTPECDGESAENFASREFR